jgi:serine/threonine protein kinase
MEYVEGGDLHHCVSGPLPEGEAKTIVHQVAEGLQIMHDMHFSHRDLKPTVQSLGVYMRNC